MKEMKTLTMGGTTYETVDAQARRNIVTKCASPITETISGTAVASKYSAESPLRNLHMWGKTTQLTTTGIQLFDKSATTSGLLEEDGSVIEDGAYVTSDFIPVTPSTSYYQTYKNSIRCKYYDADKVALSDTWDMQTASAITFMTPDDAYYLRTTVGAGYVDTFMLHKGTESVDYEPYTGGMASPCPDYLQDLIHAGADNGIEFDVMSGNLINTVGMTVGANTSIDVSSDGYTITVLGGTANGYTSSVVDVDLSVVDALRDKTLLFTAEEITRTQEGTKCGPQVAVKHSSGTDYYLLTEAGTREVPIPTDVVSIRIGAYSNNTGTALELDNCVVIKGLQLALVKTEWTPYTAPTAHTINLTLSGVKVDSGGNYIDPDGQEWITDEVDFEQGKFIQRILTVNFDDVECVRNEFPTSSGLYRFNMVYSSNAQFLPANNSYINNSMCNALIGSRQPLSSNSVDNTIACYQYGGMYARCDQFTTPEDFVAWAQEIGLTISYVLAEPIETALSDEMLKVFESIYTTYPTTTMFNSENVGMEITYNTDTKRWIIDCISTNITAAEITAMFAV